MSIIPLLYELSDMDDFYPRRRQLDPFGFGIDPRDIIYPTLEFYPNHHHRNSQNQQLRKLFRHKDNAVKESVGKDGFQVCMDVQQFKPSEINVKAVDDWIVVEGKHEEKKDDHGLVSRHFVRKYQLPKGYDPNQVATTLSSDGVLTVKAPPPTKSIAGNERVIQIQQTGPAHLSVKENPKEGSNENAAGGDGVKK